MRTTQLQRVDLNLLVALAALLEERHVSRAADRIGLSQPATSRALQRLRRTLDDELLVRTRDGYQLTPRAERIQRELAGILPRLEVLFGTEGFDPATATDDFRLMGTDFAATIFGPGLARRLSDLPGISMTFRQWHDGVFEDVSHGLVDLAFAAVSIDPTLRSELLFDERFVCLMAAANPLADREALSLQDFLGVAHVVVDVLQGEQSAVDRRLTELGLHRRATLSVPYHTAAILAIPETPLVATLPERLVSTLDNPALKVVAAPPEVEPMPYLMTWHPRLDDDPAQRWLRDLVRVVAAQT
ncbi:LysR family transcriptional regulator [Actinophytocola oryzae]|uniref:LysR family transcriptional regulator n=1 Tax=Actinophytocola oryzae TaxID=502181 RepID=UPI001AAFE3ED|nr:LysR family transcriptional regulator [Actinophytocola oryzae]